MENPGSAKAIRMTSLPQLCNAFEKPGGKKALMSTGADNEIIIAMYNYTVIDWDN